MLIYRSASHDAFEWCGRTLAGVALGVSSNEEVIEHRLGNRSALEWIIDQYQVSTDKRTGITNDPNRADDPQYIVRLSRSSNRRES